MNEALKYMIAAAAIAGICTGAGVVIGWTLANDSGPRSEVSGQKSEIRSQALPLSIPSPVASGPSSIFSGQRMPQNPVFTIPPKPSGSNVAFRPTLPMAKPPISYNQFQQLQDLPEVKKAREEFMEAQKKYSEAMKKAMGTPPNGGGQMAVGRSEMGGSSNQFSVNSGQKVEK